MFHVNLRCGGYRYVITIHEKEKDLLMKNNQQIITT